MIQKILKRSFYPEIIFIILFLMFPFFKKQIVIAATALTKTNNESALTRYIYLERKANGWQIVDEAG